MTTSTETLSAGAVLAVPGTSNFRGTGGYAAAAGAVHATGLFRSDALHNLDSSGIAALDEFGITRVLDLRDAIELGLEPSAVAGTHIEVVHHPIFGEGGLSSIGSFDIDDVYRFVVEHRAGELTEAMRLIATAPDGAVLVHCTAGKDRTGLVVATALAAIGVAREQIIADYVVSEENLAGDRADRILAAARMRFGDLDPGAIELMVGSPARAITIALELMDELHGGVEQMLLNNGLDDADLSALRARLVA